MDPYQILGIGRDADEDRIKKAYRELSKKYHPDLNPGDDSAAKKMSDINAAYDQIQKGGAQAGASSQTGSAYGSYGPYSSYGPYRSYGPYSSYGSYGPFGGYAGYGAYQQSARQQYERSEYTAAVNYIRNGMYREAINCLNGVPMTERDARWYYLSAGANMYLGNRVEAMKCAQRACEIEPENEEYQMLLRQLQSGGDFYDSYTTKYQSGIPADKLCLTLCALNACMGPMCGWRFFCC